MTTEHLPTLERHRELVANARAILRGDVRHRKADGLLDLCQHCGHAEFVSDSDGPWRCESCGEAS